ncbi:MAG: beta-ketoacyl-[acyl-carrier-protein] synthase family protein [Candidatus Omnitrophica bacterium]|nr:beta-ketoacyl-[acyl-carrier-protein] synthase family protein [Candidatus Omnitrophota bacterium]
MKTRRVVITGLGAVTPLGNNVGDTWRALREGKSGIGRITLFDAGTFPTKIAGEVKHLSPDGWASADPGFKRLGRNSLFALEAAREAFDDAGIDRKKMDSRRVGIYMGAGDGGFDFGEYAAIVSRSIRKEDSSVDAWGYFRESAGRVNPETLVEQEPCQVIRHLAHYFGAKGFLSNCLTACAASSQAIGEAAEVIRMGHAEVMISGGSHSMIHPLGVAGFNLLTALSTQNDPPERASRPFDRTRDGFVLSEGAGVVILEELEHAKKRDARIYAELTGYGGTADAFRLTDPHPAGRGAVRAMRLALEDANVRPENVDCINAHGTSTQLNDQIETQAVKEVFGETARRIPMSSIKSMLGHMIAAAGAVELVASVLTIREGVIPPTINYRTPDENCDLDYVPNHARRAAVDTVLSNSFGFGGQNIDMRHET